MRHSLAKFVFILVLAKIDQLDSRAVEVVYTSDGCECTKNLPYQVNIPVVPEPPEYCAHSYGYKIEKPAAQAMAKYTYSFDFVAEEPIAPVAKVIPKENLFATIDKIVLPKPDCVLEVPAPVPTQPQPPPPPPPAHKACKYDKTKVCTCGTCPGILPAADYDYMLDAPIISKSCLCGKCLPSKPLCRYVLSGTQTNSIARPEGRFKRDVSLKEHPYINKVREHLKAFKTTRNIKKSKVVKRDIKGEYDMLEKDQAALDLTLPEIIQYMPETLMPNFKRGKCNIGCKSCKNKHPTKQETNSIPETDDKSKNEQPQQLEKPSESSNENIKTLPNQLFHDTPRFIGANYLKRSVTPYQYPHPCYPALMPPPYIPSPLHLATFAQNPGNPIWYQPRPLIDPNGHYVYDRLGHKYEVKNGSLKLVAPESIDEVNASALVADPIVGNIDANLQTTTAALQKPSEVLPPLAGGQLFPAPIVGAPVQHHQSNDPQMDKIIRDIIYKHPDFIDATEHAPGSLTMSQNVQSGETMQFLDKLIRGRLNNWFGINENVPNPNVHDFNRYSRETGTSIKFIPVVTVDKSKLNKFRQETQQSAT